MGTSSGAEEPEEPSSHSICPICEGAGFIHPRLPSGEPDFSQVIACRCAREELTKEHQRRLQQSSGLDFELLKSMTFENFDWQRVNLPPDQRENLKEAFDLALDYAKSPDGWLVFQGVTGCGKTHLAAAIANYRLQGNKPVKLVVVPDFLDHLRSTFSPESKVSYDQLFEEVKSTPLLILDDFGEQSTTPWAQEKLYQVINYRYNARLSTVITTRYTTDEIDSPISSRLIYHKLSVFFTITAPDYRGDLPPTPKTRTYRRAKKEH